MSIGSVAFDVVPDATGFYQKFIAKTRGDMDKAGVVLGKAVGSKLGDTAGAEARTRLQAALKDLKANVDLDTGKAEAQAAALRRSLDNVGDSKGVKNQSKDLKLLSTALLAAGSAAIPLAGVATGAIIGLGAAAGVAVVGILGIRDAMKSGSDLGRKYEAAFKPITTEFGHLKQIAAQGMFDGINRGVKALTPLFPTINRDVALFSGQMGQIVGHIAPAFATLFTRINPLFATFGDQLVKGSAAFQHWAQSSDAVGRFVAYIQNSLPAVEQTFGSLITTVSHVAIGLEPFGSTVLTSIRLFSQAINTIPVGVLQTVLPLIAGLKIGNTFSNSINNASVGLGKFAENIGKSSGLAAGASGAVGKLGKVVGNLGPVGIVAGAAIGALSVVMGHGKQAAIEQTNRINELTAALQNNTVAQTILSQLQKQGAVSAANSLGISQKQLLDSLTGSAAKFNDLSAQLKQQGAEYDRLAEIRKKFLTQGAQEPNLTAAQQKQYDNLGKTLPKLSDALSKEYDAYQKAKAAAADMAKQLGDNALANQIQSDSVDKVAKSLGTTSGSYIQAKLAADQQAQATAQSTLQMRLANDAAGLLQQSLDRLGNQNASVLAAQTSLASANNSVTASFKANRSAIIGSSAAAIANQQALQGQHDSALALATAIGKQTGSTLQEIQSLKGSKAALEATLRSQGRLTPAVQAYIDKLYNLKNLRLPPTKIDVNKAAADSKVAAFKRSIIAIPRYKNTAVNANTAQALARLRDYRDHLNSLNGKTAYTYIQAVVLGQQQAANKRQAGSAFAEGGVVSYYADGGVRRFADGAHVAQIAPAGAMRVWAEPETGGEAYIPLASSKRSRSQAIMSEVAGRFGDTYIANYASGGVNAKASPGAFGNMFQVTIEVATPQIYGGTNHQLAAAIRDVVVPGLEEYVGSGGRINIGRGVNG